MRHFLSLCLGMALLVPAAAQSAEPAATEWTESIQGDLPVVITAPHGGRQKPEGWPERRDGIKRADAGTDRLAMLLAQQLRKRTDHSPYLVSCRVSRSRVDMNRNQKEAAYGFPAAEKAWQHYHQSIAEHLQDAEQRFGRVLLIDIHGQGRNPGWFELGYRLKASDLKEIQSSETGADITALPKQSTLFALGPDPQTLRSALVGPHSLGKLMQDVGLNAVPSPASPTSAGRPYYSGGYTLLRHVGTANPSIIGIQLECPRVGYRDTAIHRERLAKQLACVIDRYLKAWHVSRVESDLTGATSG
ncbi:MAG: hypothetical protein AAGA03_19565 [Planctomycetota bacterium]